jgi:hypothetical protein
LVYYYLIEFDLNENILVRKLHAIVFILKGRRSKYNLLDEIGLIEFIRLD